MDHFGIGAALQGLAHAYMDTARQTGRTTSLVDSVKDGDRIITHSHAEALRLTRLCAERGIKVQCIHVDPQWPNRLLELGTLPGDGRTLFDHPWVELFYLRAIQKAHEDIDTFQQRMSGYGAPHRETRRKYQEMRFVPPKYDSNLDS